MDLYIRGIRKQLYYYSFLTWEIKPSEKDQTYYEIDHKKESQERRQKRKEEKEAKGKQEREAKEKAEKEESEPEDKDWDSTERKVNCQLLFPPTFLRCWLKINDGVTEISFNSMICRQFDRTQIRRSKK